MRSPDRGCRKVLPRLLLLVLVALAWPRSGEAANPILHVNTTLDTLDTSPTDGLCSDENGLCSLRAAIMEANARLGPDTVVLPVPFPNTPYLLTLQGTGEDAGASGDLDVTDDLVLKVAVSRSTAKRIIDAAGLGPEPDRVLHVHAGSTVQISGVMLRNGRVEGDPAQGGCVLNQGALTLSGVIVRDCVASGDPAVGGGIASTSTGTLTLQTSLVTKNLAEGIGIGAAEGFGGGVSVSGTGTILNSTIHDNIAQGDGGGVYSGLGTLVVSRSTITQNDAVLSVDPSTSVVSGGGILARGEVVVVNSTISRNTVQGEGAGISAGSYMTSLTNVTVFNNTASEGDGGALAGTQFTLANTIVAGNTPADCSLLPGYLVSQGHNLDSDATCLLVGPGDLPGQNPLLGLLQDNGGPTLTHAPAAGSPAIGGGDNLLCPASDQRFVTRPTFSVCDIGAVEYAATLRTSLLHPQKLAMDALRSDSIGVFDPTVEGGQMASVSMSVAAPGDDALEQVRGFLESYGAAYLMTAALTGLPRVRVAASSPDGGEGLALAVAAGGPVAGMELVRLAQTYRDVPVFGAELVLHIAPGAAGEPARVVHSSGRLLPALRTDTAFSEEVDLDTIPAIQAVSAEAAAAAFLGSPLSSLRGQTILTLFAPWLIGEPGETRLAYRVALATSPGPVEVLVDAHTGDVLFQHDLWWSHLPMDPDLRLTVAEGASNCPSGASLVGDEGGVDPDWSSDPDIATLWQAATVADQSFHDLFQRHSFDDNDGLTELHLELGTLESGAMSSPLCISVGSGWASLDGFVHEVAHLLTDAESRLLYHGEPGALAEAFSDLMGATLDPQDWTLGEDRTGGQGPLRDLFDPPSFTCGLADQEPPLFPCPDRYSQYRQSMDDHGGIHTNSGIIGKAFALMADGGQFNGIQVTGFGRDKMGRLVYDTFSHLPSAASFHMARGDAVQWAGAYASGSLYGFTDQDLCTVRNAFAAVEIGAPDVDCDGSEDGVDDPDQDGIPDDGDRSGVAGDSPCAGGQTLGCDDNCPQVPNTNQSNLDGDPLGDVCDDDDDNDGEPDPHAPCAPDPPSDGDGDGIADCLDPDADGDGVPEDGDDSTYAGDSPCGSGEPIGCDDNCPLIPNPEQTDSDGNGHGDACEPDVDGDEIYPDADNCPYVANPLQSDADGDGLGDACDLCPDTPDNLDETHPGFPELGIDPFPVQPDSDGDGLPDACDPLGFGSLGVLLDGSPYSPFGALQADGVERTLSITGPEGGGGTVRLQLPLPGELCGDQVSAPSLLELALSGLEAELTGWVEDGSGRLLGAVGPHQGDPSTHGARLRPRCERSHYLVLQTLAAFDGGAEIMAQANPVPPDPVNPWTSDPPLGFEPPAPLPDGDGDGLWDAIDRCPGLYSPANRDSDADGFGDPCDTCPTVFNPEQQPLPFPPVTAPTPAAFGWETATGFDYIKGTLDLVPVYGAYEAGSGSGTGFPISDLDPSPSYYLFRHDQCGTWGGAERDAALP